MIREIRVDGFRSLLKFEIKLDTGINVIVGSNGTGKSNFIAFMDFLSVFIDKGLNSAIGIARGAGAVFSREYFNETEATLNFSISGSWIFDEKDEDMRYYLPDNLSSSGAYVYSCELKYLRAATAVYIAREKISIEISSGRKYLIERKTERSDKDFEITIPTFEMDSMSEERFLRWLRRDKKDIAPSETLRQYLSIERSMFSVIAGEDVGIDFAMRDLVGYQSVNIDPIIARRPTPVGAASVLEPTGEGLAGVLYQIQRGTFISTSERTDRMFRRRVRRTPSFESIISWCKEINPAIRQISVELNFLEAQFRPSMYFAFERKTEIFPFARISDGTVKWVTLVTMLLAEPRLNIIEEPENFLHPFMQETFVNLCRQVLSAEPSRTIIVSTHSPILIDYCDAKELTMFELDFGQTRAAKVENWEELNKKIVNSRFGLGHYYRTGAIYGADSSDGRRSYGSAFR